MQGLKRDSNNSAVDLKLRYCKSIRTIAPEEKCHPVRVRVEVRVRVSFRVRGQLSSGAIVLEPLQTYMYGIKVVKYFKDFLHP